MKKIIPFLMVTFMLTACVEECYNAPLPIVFEFVNENGDNLIKNGAVNPFTIKDENQVAVQVTKTDDDRIVLENVGLFNGTKNYTFSSPVRTFNFSIESSEFKGGCDGFQINKLTFTGIAIDVKDENGYYKIILK